MIAKRLSLPGNFVEGFVYFDFLWLISAEGDVWAFDILKFVEDRFPDPKVAEAVQLAFARNDQLEFGGVELRLVPDHIELCAAEVEQYSRIFDTKLDFKSILDMRCYYGRAFIATDRSIKQLDVFGRDALAHVPSGRRANGQLGGDIVHDGRCIQFRCQYGIVSASCTKDGGFYASGALSNDKGWRARFKKFSEASFATEFIADRLTNVPDLVEVEFFKTDYHRKDAGPDDDAFENETTDEGDEKFEITDVTETDEAFGKSASRAILGADRQGRISRVFLSKNVLFTVDFEHRVRTVRLTEGQNLAVPKSGRPFAPAPGPILAMTSSAVGMVAELDDAVFVLSEGRWHEIFEEPVYSVRGYPSSKWYRKLTTAVGDERVDLIFMI